MTWSRSVLTTRRDVIALSNNPSDSDRAQLETYKQPYTQCLLAKGYKSQ